jgi:hypothetical protein
MADVDWQAVDLGELAERLSDERSQPDAERTLWAFQRVLEIARGDPELLDYVLTASICLVARSGDMSPRHVLETWFRRAPSDERWSNDIRPLLD